MSFLNRSWLFLIAVALTGCQGESHESLHEADHFTPLHWPADLADAVQKIDDRLSQLQKAGAEQAASEQAKLTQKELVDIVGWMPEVSADSFIDESQWIPINEASLELSSLLPGMSLPMDSAMEQKIKDFRNLIAETAELEVKNRPPFTSESGNEAIQEPFSETNALKEAES
jgi:DNA uptake protein ComE-like DNA-binding protein